jgi:FkbH-like protein
VWDYAGLVASQGVADWTDARLWALARLPVSAANQPVLAAHLMRSLRALLRPAAKCLVLDLDDTRWGGVVGDEGLGGIRLGDEYPGSAFKRFQRAVLGVRDRGILLAVCSANDADVALEALRTHPEMVLRPEHFAATRINWGPKSENLREIADELNIGVDSLILFDDNPAVRAEVRDRLPEVLVVEVPSDPVLYVEALASVVELDAPSVTAEDRGRAASMAAGGERRAALERSASLGDFLGSLEMAVEIGSLDVLSSQRIAQLVAKTNQYNLTTRRRSQAELESVAAREDACVQWLRLRDRYGDMGLVLVAILVKAGQEAVVDSLVLSCRAANRGLEQTMLAHLAGVARSWGCRALVGEYVATERNHVVEGLYPALGFAATDGAEGVTRFRLDLETGNVERPGYVALRASTES